MTLNQYPFPPETIDMKRAEQSIRRASVITLLLYTLAVVGAYFLFPLLVEFPEETLGSLVFALQSSLVVFSCLIVAISKVATGRRFSREDISGSAAGPPSKKIAIDVAFLNNTLEQVVAAIGVYLILATLLSSEWLFLILVNVTFFVVGRVLFYLGYAKGAEGRALGMTLTFLPTVLGYCVAFTLLGINFFS